MIYPNPSSGIYRIESEKPILEYEIFDISGKCLLYKRNPENIFDISIFPKGIYFIKTLTEGQVVVNKLLKE